MNTNPMKESRKYGQSLWLDNIRRALMTSGALKQLIDEGLMGVTSNPTIFEKAIAGSKDYDEQMRSLISGGRGVPEILTALTVRDIQMAADLFRPVYEKTKGEEGFVSIELDPALAHRTGATVKAAEALRPRLNRNNVMIKVPATEEGIPAIEALTAEGFSINVTLIFSVEQYEQVAWAYIAGLKKWIHRGRPNELVRSVASVFVSRLDTVVDRLIHERLPAAKTASEREVLNALLGKAGIANAKRIYRKFKEIFHGPAFLDLQKQGAAPQRPLWASTGTKNPNYSDVLYVEALIGPNTVNTVPPATLSAFRDHGKVRASLEEDLEEAEAVLEKLTILGIDLRQMTLRLQEEGVASFSESFQKLGHCIAAKRERMLGGRAERFSASLGRYEAAVREKLDSLEEERFAEKLWAKRPSLWKSDPKIQEKIRNRLGWLTIAEAMAEEAGNLMAFARSIRDSGFTHVVLLGMGGSSLCPEVCRKTFGLAPDFPDLQVLDSTDPATIRRVERSIDLKTTLFILASKSGATIEMHSLYQYFLKNLQGLRNASVWEHFVAITDPGTPLEKAAQENRFRKIFLTPPDIGGRYSALTYFGLVPLALIGVDVAAFLDRALEMVQASQSCVPAEENPGIRLGTILGVLGGSGRDKVTLIASPAIGGFGYWLEQLLAESTGKEGKGLLPIEGEEVGDPEVYGEDRLFVSLQVASDKDEAMDRKLRTLQDSGHPVVRILLREPLDLAGEFFRWELATATAGAILGINPFDEPNVTESKENTQGLLDGFRKSGRFPSRKPILEEEGIRLFSGSKTEPGGSFEETVWKFLNPANALDYIALMAYLESSAVHEALLQRLRSLIRDRTRLATTVGYGPRFLHSTGQFHKGGPNTGRFIQITAEDQEALPIPGEDYGFSLLKQAQALGDYLSLANRGVLILEIRLGREVESDLRTLIQWMESR